MTLKEPTGRWFDIVFDGPPSHESGRFVEVEDSTGESVKAGDWIDRGNGLWALRIQYEQAMAIYNSAKAKGLVE